MMDIRAILIIVGGTIGALLALGAALLIRDDLGQRAKVTDLSAQVATMERTKKATDDALTLALNKKGDIDHEYTTIIRQIPPTSDACKRDPGVIAAYAAIRGMRDKDASTGGNPAGPAP